MGWCWLGVEKFQVLSVHYFYGPDALTPKVRNQSEREVFTIHLYSVGVSIEFQSQKNGQKICANATLSDGSQVQQTQNPDLLAQWQSKRRGLEG